MIDPESRTTEWISNVAKENRVKDLNLVEKVIRAFSLLEALARSGCPFVFKGGSSLLLHFESAKRLSIDIDIICPIGTEIEDYIRKYSEEYGFGEVQLVERAVRRNIPKQHTEFYYEVAYPKGKGREKILLDVLFEDLYYTEIVELPIKSPFIKSYGDAVSVRLPSKEDLLGDKLTAFAPHTTGIPFFKGERDCAMEINKQLFDIGTLFDAVNNLSATKSTFNKLWRIELGYKGREGIDMKGVLDDIYNTALCIVLRGYVNLEEFKLLDEGIKRIRGFIHSELYTIERAVVNASKVAYLSKLLEKDIMEIKHFNPSEVEKLSGVSIVPPLATKINKLKKTNVEAFFYWNEIQNLDL